MTKSGKIILRGKYRAAIDQFVKSTPLQRMPTIDFNDEFDVMVNTAAKAYSRYLDVTQVTNIILDTICDFDSRNADEDGALIGDLAELQKKLVDDIVAALAAFPRDYRVTLQFYPSKDWPDARYELGDNVALLFQSGRGFLEFELTGYANSTSDTGVALTAYSKAKIFVFLAHNYLPFNSHIGQTGQSAEARDCENNTVIKMRVPDPLARCLNGLNLDAHMRAKLLQPAGDAAIEVALADGLRFVKNVFALEGKTGYDAIAAAIEWYEDSRFASNQTVALLSACIGLEALLRGEEQESDLSNRLADRYAYMLGRNPTQRKELFGDYKSVLTLRGKLVHSKQARLSEEDRVILRRSQGMLKAVIKHELAALLEHHA
ncbi:hypothetical protein [Duganella sp. Dugasp56]|uniref:hypothetical protein n=1 Tax=Duganella sp. Dugasp56 TaxID=3243046 RepID=UPI0039B0AF07